jgi:hypothetical protein
MFEADDGNTEKEHVMQTTVRNLVVLVVFAMALTGLSLAQDSTYRVTANVPFDFNVGDQHLPAGEYLFEVEPGSPVVTVRSTTTGRAEMILAIAGDGERNGNPVLEFDVIGENHLLAELKTADAGVNFPEKKTLLASAKRKESVAIVASLR